MRLLRKRFYKFLRNAFPSLQFADHEKMRRRLSLAYMIAAWQLFGATIYYVYHSQSKTDTSGLTPAERYITSGIQGQTARIISLSPFGVVQDRQISEEELTDLRKKKGDAAAQSA